MQQKVPLRIIDREFNLLGEIDKYSSLQMLHSWSEIGELELRINRYMQYADKLQQGCILFPYNRTDHAFIIRHREIELDENGKETENWLIKAPSLKSFVAQRMIYPAPGKAHESVTGDAETVMRHFVYTQMINPVDPGRIYPNLILAPNQNRGPMLEEKSRFDMLDEKLIELSKLHGLGWNIELDLNNKQFVFTILEGNNFVANGEVLPQVIFSTERETLAQLEYTESFLDYKNYAVVAGQGEGVDRRIVSIGDAVGADRYEMFVDARDIGDQDDEGNPLPADKVIANLKKRGEEKLAESTQEIYMSGQALYNATQKFGQDYNIGDSVTVRDRGWRVTMDARISAVKEIVENNKHAYELVFDNDKPTFMSKMKKEISAINPELKK